MSGLFLPTVKDDRQHLLAVVRSVRRRWRLRMLLRGLTAALLAALMVWLVAAYAIDASRFDPAVVAAVRLVAYLFIAVALVWGLGRPLARRVSDEQVALYVEEHEPSLEGQLLSAVELEQESLGAAGASPAMVERLVEAAAEACQAVDDGKRIERTGLWRSSGAVAGTTAVGFALFLMGPGFLHNALPVLLDPGQAAQAVSPYSIRVEPGDVTLAEGADLEVTAWLEGFDAADVELAVRAGDDEWSRFAMLREAPAEPASNPPSLATPLTAHRLILFELRQPTQYFVEASGVRSAVHRVEVMELPYVETIGLTYRFPAYTGLDPLQQDDSGDIAALIGTEVELQLTSTLAVTGGLIEVLADSVDRIDGGDASLEQQTEVVQTIPLEVAAGAASSSTLTGALTVRETGVYRIRLDHPSAAGETVIASPEYLIDPLHDQPPTVRLARPGRDLQVTSLEEVAIEAQAEDDFGVSRLALVYSVNGGAEQSATLYRGLPGRKDFVGSHTLFLEEYELEPGDLVSYYVRAWDAYDGGAADREAHQTVSDIYFLEIRPFDRTFRRAEGGGAGQQGLSGDELTAQQRLILAATFKLARSRTDRGERFGNDVATVTLSQGRLRQDVLSLVERLQGGGVAPRADSPWAQMAEVLPQAAEEMGRAEQLLGENRPDDALAPEQRALRLLQRAEAAFREIQVSRGESGGGRGEISDELADLFEMDLDRLGNQYEQVQRGQRGSVDDTLDETLEKLRELARRQQQENERLRARARQSSQAARAGGSGRSQRQLADEAEEVARRLERLARQESLPELAETARKLREAVEEMRRAAASGEDAAEALGDSALDRLRQARRQLERDKSGRLARDTARAIERTRRLRQQQESMVQRVDRLDPGDPYQQDAVQSMLQAKQRMGAEVGELEAELDQLARESRREQAEAARRLAGAAGGIRDRKIREKILYSRGVVQERSREYARNFEDSIAQDLAELEAGLRDAASAIGESRAQRLERALEETRDVTTALEAVGERLRDDGQAAPADGGGAPTSDASLGSGAGAPRGAQSGSLTAETLRQLDRDLGRRRAQLETLRERLRREEVDAADLDRIIDRLRGIAAGSLRAPENLAALESDVVQGLKEFEYGLRRQLTADRDQRLLQVADDEVPEGYEEMVDRYYKALAVEKP
ncbi:MAG: hypothetical protein AAF657_19600 [Acidobacteriota bacterium]